MTTKLRNHGVSESGKTSPPLSIEVYEEISLFSLMPLIEIDLFHHFLLKHLLRLDYNRRYSTQAPSSVIPVDVQHHSNLADSLAEYTKGELLETENAYYCEQCDKKVSALLELILVIKVTLA